MAAMNDLANLNKLKYEQNKFLNEHKEIRENKERIRNDYLKLKEKLKTFSDEVTRDAIVPIGEVAFFPGKFIHTNEITVLLGDNWFVERSSKQAMEIVERRIKMVDVQLNDLTKEFNNIKSQFEYTDHFQAISDGHGEITEIKETFEEDFKPMEKGKSRKAHIPKHNLTPRIVKIKTNKITEKNMHEYDNVAVGIGASSNNDNTINHNELLARLNLLEKEEQEEEEKEHAKIMNDILEGNFSLDNVNDTSLNNETKETVEATSEHKHVQFDSDVYDTLHSYADSDQEDRENVIKFQHSSNVQRDRSASESDILVQHKVNTPADIYEQYRMQETDERPLKSILKKDSRSNSNENLRLRPILKTSPEHRPGTPEYVLDDQPKPILKTPPDTQGSERRPGTPEYGLADDPKPILKSHYDSTDYKLKPEVHFSENMLTSECTSETPEYGLSDDPKPILKSNHDSTDCKTKPEVHFSENNSYILDYDNDEMKSILKNGDNVDDEQRSLLKQEYPRTILKSPEAVRNQKVFELSTEPRPILKHHFVEAFSGQVLERDVSTTSTNKASKVSSSQKPVSKFKASRSKK